MNQTAIFTLWDKVSLCLGFRAGRAICLLWIPFFLVLITSFLYLPAVESGRALDRAAEFIKDRRFNDAIRVLTAEIGGKDESAMGTEFLLLGEANYRLGQYEPAKAAFQKALKNLTTQNDKAKADYRLACVQYRQGDFKAALERIEGYVSQRGIDPQVGTLLVYKLAILAARGRPAQAEMEAVHKQIYEGASKVAANSLSEADQILCIFYSQNGMADKAFDLYARLLKDLRKQIQDLGSKDASTVPASLGKAHDAVCLQLGVLYLEKKNPQASLQHLETVRYDPETMAKARLMLARLAFERGDPKAAQTYLTKDNKLDLMPDSALKSDMHLILGLCEKARADGNPTKVEEWLRKVGPDSKGYAQAQNTLGDLYRDLNLASQAAKNYEKVLTSGNTDYAANALYNLACIALAEGQQDPKVATAKYRTATDLFKQLHTRFPLSSLTRQSREKIEFLAKQGLDVAFARSAEDQVKTWTECERQSPGTLDAAQALLQLMRHHAKAIAEEKTGKLLKAPDWALCATAADRLLDSKIYKGTGIAEESWKEILAEAGLWRGLAEVNSISPPTSKSGDAPITYLKGAKAEEAVKTLTLARASVPVKNLALVKSLDLALIEAMFKSPVKEHKIRAETRYSELEGEYGTDPRYQKLALDLGDWYREQGAFAEAAKQYQGVADRGREMNNDDLVKIYFTAGSLYSRAGKEAQKSKDLRAYTIQISSQTGLELGEDVRKSYAPMARKIALSWPNAGRKIQASVALATVSKISGQPFVWGPQSPVNAWLNSKVLDLESGSMTVAQALEKILDPSFVVVFDIGLSGGKPNLQVSAAQDEVPEEDKIKILEIYDGKEGLARFSQLQRRIGRIQTGGRPVMLYDCLRQIETACRLRTTWAQGVDKDGKLAVDLKTDFKEQQTCAEVLTAVLPGLGLKATLQRQDVAAELYEQAKDCFNKVRKIDPKSNHGERALFSVALNYFSLKDYQRMKVILREYVKVFDQPSFEYWHQANFWIGWCFENEKRYSDAVTYYARAAEERVVMVRAQSSERAPQSATQSGTATSPVLLDRAAVRAQMSYDTQFALGEMVSGEFKEASAEQCADFLRSNSHLNIVVDPSVTANWQAMNKPAFKQSGFELLCEILDTQGLALKVENIEPDIAQRAFYRMASVYRSDGLLPQALESAQLLLRRYPATERRRETQSLMLQIYRGLKRYVEVIATLDLLASEAKDPEEKRRIQIEVAWIHFDMADYTGAVERLKPLLTGARQGEESLRLSDAYARALLRAGRPAQAADEYDFLAKESPLAADRTIAGIQAWACRQISGKTSAFPSVEQTFLDRYGRLSDAERKALAREDHIRATWNYWALAQVDVQKERWDKAQERLQACVNAPDDALAADALVQYGRILKHLKEWKKAQENFEYVLVFTTTAESAVRSTYHLGECLDALERPASAKERYLQVINRFPLSPYAERARLKLSMPPGPGAKPIGVPGPLGENTSTDQPVGPQTESKRKEGRTP